MKSMAPPQIEEGENISTYPSPSNIDIVIHTYYWGGVINYPSYLFFSYFISFYYLIHIYFYSFFLSFFLYILLYFIFSDIFFIYYNYIYPFYSFYFLIYLYYLFLLLSLLFNTILFII